uniref:MULE transposase domain-containing protein n=1 Tax=Lactuca sativa TaxID=4236 RepID=A0A9R1XH86_LACSA|nr:hypothetical protein LSAT_V11C500264300 [Lactuca sativa]
MCMVLLVAKGRARDDCSAHTICLAWDMLQSLPHVVLMDATYKTNNYNLPFLEIVGVTSTSKMFSISFTFIHNEKMRNYRWALTCLKLKINDSFCPRVIITDRNLALMKVCEDVFPQSNLLFFRWHIFNNITKNCRTRIRSKMTWDFLHPKWNKLVESPTPSAYMKAYAELQALFTNFGNSTTNRVERQHSKLKKHLGSQKCYLDKFIYTRLLKIISQGAYCNPKFKDEIFKSLWHHVSEHALDKILEELHRSKGFLSTSENCGCQLWTYFELPCTHELPISHIMLDSVDVFLRSLDLRPFVYVDYGNLNVDHHMQRFIEKFKNPTDHAKYNYIKWMDEITIHQKFCSDLNQEPPRHSSSFINLNDKHSTCSSVFMGTNEEPIG